MSTATDVVDRSTGAQVQLFQKPMQAYLYWFDLRTKSNLALSLQELEFFCNQSCTMKVIK